MPDRSPFRRASGGVSVDIRLTPKASGNVIRGIVRDADGQTRLKVTVTAVPEDGKANAALLKLLAKTWKLPKSSLSIASGATSRQKTVHIAGQPDDLLEIINAWERAE